MITVRTVDPGALVTSDNPSEARPLFYLMQTDPLRVFVNVPQVFATTIASGQNAAVYREEDPNHQFSGRVTRTANALDPNTRTLLTQVDVPNPNDALRPGMYLQVKFTAPTRARAVLIPSAAPWCGGLTGRSSPCWTAIIACSIARSNRGVITVPRWKLSRDSRGTRPSSFILATP